MSPSAQFTSEQVKEIIEDKKTTDQGAREVQDQVQNGEELLNPDNSSLVWNIGLNTINNKLEHMCLNVVVRLLDAHRIPELQADRVPGNMYSIPGMPGTKFLVHQVCTIPGNMRRWVRDTDMPGALAADEMGRGKTFTSVAVGIIYNLLTEKIVMGLPWTMLCDSTHEA